MPKSTENTVFVRFIPPPIQKVMRHQLEDIFSQTGPIKKSSWIHSQRNDSSKGYGFVKYVSHDDAEAATRDLHDTKIKMDGQEYLLKVELASLQAQQLKQTTKGSVEEETENKGQDSSKASENDAELKKKSRIILRNLSFYAKESHILKAVEEKFGKVVDVHLPHVQSNLHVGFCFVTFSDPKDAQKAVNAKQIEIKKRNVSMNWSIPKKLHKQQQQISDQKQKQSKQDEKNQSDKELEEKMPEVSGEDNVSAKSEDSQDDEDSDDESKTSHGSSFEGSSGNADSSGHQKRDDGEAPLDDSVSQKRTLFVRNLPFDTTRHDLFQLFSQFGYIQAIYLVKDKDTGMLKGTAFVTFSKPESAQRAVEQGAISSSTSQGGNGESFVPQRQATTSSDVVKDPERNRASSLVLRGRNIILDFAVDKETAETFDSKEHNHPSADRRNMYLQAEGRVESSSTDPNANNANTWDDLPEQDQKKRQSALKEKTTKLHSPIFFINPNRVAIRNLAKHLDEAALQQLCKQATMQGLQKGLVGAADQIAQWRALGESSTRDILAKVQDSEAKNIDIVPAWDAKVNIKEYVPSAFIDRDFGPTGKKANSLSRGFGFVEFKHHVHALACLRELNNNTSYSRDYAAGGKAADASKKKVHKRKGKSGKGSGIGDYVSENGHVRVPRLIVDFAVENKVKAKKQAERRLHQQVNQSKQLVEKQHKSDEEKKNNKRNRGALQRERKRLRRESGSEKAAVRGAFTEQLTAENNANSRKKNEAKVSTKTQVKSVKPPKKKKKVDKDDEKFESIVDNYRSKVEVPQSGSSPRAAATQKRWFE